SRGPRSSRIDRPMTMRRKGYATRVPGLATLALWASLASAGVGRAATPPVQLVETRLVETGLGDPALPAARETWIEMIRGAQRTLDLEQFYLSHRPGEALG